MLFAFAVYWYSSYPLWYGVCLSSITVNLCSRSNDIALPVPFRIGFPLSWGWAARAGNVACIAWYNLLAECCVCRVPRSDQCRRILVVLCPAFSRSQEPLTSFSVSSTMPSVFEDKSSKIGFVSWYTVCHDRLYQRDKDGLSRRKRGQPRVQCIYVR